MRAFFAAFVASLAIASPAADTITTVAGFLASSPGNVPALFANLDQPGSVVVDAAGNAYFVENGARIRKISAAGTLTTLATVAGVGLAIDAGGNVHVASGTRIHRIDPAGNVTVVAGNGVAGFAGDNGPAASASLDNANGIGFDDAGNLLIADGGNHRVRKVSAGVITTVAGTGVAGATGNGGPAVQAQLTSPAGIVRDGAGGYFIAEIGPSNYRIRRVSASGEISTHASPGVMHSGDIGRDSAGNLYVATGVSPLIGRINPAGSQTIFAGVIAQAGSGAENIPATQANLGYMPKGVTVSPAGEVWISDTGNNRIRKVGTDGLINTVAGSTAGGCPPEGAPATSIRLSRLSQVAASPSGELTISGQEAHCVIRIGSGAVVRVAGTGARGSTGDGGPASAATLESPTVMTYGPAGELYINETRIRRVDPATGVISSLSLPSTMGSTYAWGFAFDSGGRLHVATNVAVWRVDGPGAVTHVAGSDPFSGSAEDGIPAVLARISPFAIAFDDVGRLVMADGARIRRVTPDGLIETVAGTSSANGSLADGVPATAAKLTNAMSIATDADGRIYLTDADRHRVRVIGRDGVINTLAGTGTAGFAGDGGPPSAAQLFRPLSIAWDEGTRSLYVYTFDPSSLRNEGRVRRITLSDSIPAAFSFPAKTGIGLTTLTASDAVTPVGFDVPAAVTVADGEYSAGCTGTFTTSPGTLQPGQSLCVRHVSAGVANADRVTTVTVSGRQATFTSTTQPGAGSLQVSVSTLDFGVQPMRMVSAPRTVTLTNSGAVSVTINSVKAPGGFAVAHDCATLAAGASCTMSVTFKPTVEGTAAGGVAVQATPGTQTVSVTGVGERSMVTHYYRTILGREPDATGKTFWSQEAARIVAAGADVNEAWFALASTFFFSPEYTGLNRTDSGYLTDLYRTFLGREPDSGGLAYWAGQLSSGMPREVALAQFMFSPEFTRLTATIFGNSLRRAEVDMVMDFYRGLLSRLPDSGGLQSWLQRFRTAQCSTSRFNNVRTQATTISGEFVASPEYVARNRTHAQFVGDLYNAFLRRGGDLPGVQYWIGQLSSAARTRANVLEAFVTSPEFSARVSRVAGEACYAP